MKTRILVCFLICIGMGLRSQTKTVNSFDQQGKKDGTWIVFLDKNWQEVSDSSNAVAFRYTFFDHGFEVFKLKLKRNDKLVSPTGSNQSKSKYLDGEYKWYDSKGRLSSTHVFKKGHYVSCKIFYKSGQERESYDFTKNYLGIPNTYFFQINDKKGNSQRYYSFNGIYGWMGYPSNFDSSTVDTLRVSNDSVFAQINFYSGSKLICRSGEIISFDITKKVNLVHDGKIATYYLNGTKKEEGEYMLGRKNGVWTYWDLNGNVTRTETYVSGVLTESH